MFAWEGCLDAAEVRVRCARQQLVGPGHGRALGHGLTTLAQYLCNFRMRCQLLRFARLLACFREKCQT